MGKEMRSRSESCMISASFLLCLLVVAFLLHTAASKGDVSGRVTVGSVGRHLHSQQGGKDSNEWPHLVFKSSQLRPPELRATGNPSEQAGQYLFMTPKGPHRENSKPVIYTLDGDLVFVDERYDHVSDFKPQTYRKDAHLTFSHGYSTGAPNPGHGYGKMVFLDNNYQAFEFDLNATITSLVDNVPGNLDFHEHIMTSSDTIFVTAYNNTPYDLSPLGGPKHGWLANSLLFEIDPLTGHVTSSWSAIEHIPLSQSRLPLPSYMGDGTKTAPFDHFHINSIQPLGADRLLINSRHTWCSYVLDRGSGEILQTIDGHELGFSWAHHARAHNLTYDGSFKMTLFDNHNMKDDKGGNYTQGLLLDVNQNEGESSVIQSFNTSFYADSQGSLQALPNGNFLLGGGRIPLIIEYDSAGDVVWKARFEKEERGYSYRTFRGAWSGTPRDWHPVVAVENGTAYVSWNGATDVESWSVYINEKFCGRASKMGFETTIQLIGWKEGDCASIGAVQDGKEVRLSNTVC